MNGASGTLIQGNYIGVGADGRSDVANQIAGLDIQTANNVIRGNVISGNNVVGSSGGLYLETGATSNLVAGNLIGLAADGTRGFGNAGPGVVITGSASRNTIGGLVAADRNMISGNGKQGVHIAGTTSSTNVIQGNYVGTDAAGSSAVGNGSEGVLIESADNVVGGVVPGSGNVISGNASHGIRITGAAATGNLVQGNYIGTNAAGTADITSPASASAGVFIESSSNTVGGGVGEARNVISGNWHGVHLSQPGASNNTIQGNWIGVGSDV